MTPFHPLLRKVHAFVCQQHLIPPNQSILAAVSGGPDSVALLHVLIQLRATLQLKQVSVIHFDHQLRGEASNEDRRFVEELAERWGVAFHCGTADVQDYRGRHHISMEMAARACRHRFFRDLLEQGLGDRIAIAHTANDQAEELLLRLVRGTGPAGMAGMLPKTANGLIRPILLATRSEILRYLADHDLTWRDDPSNRDLNHQRNIVRHQVLPLFENHFHGSIVEVLSRHARLVQEEEHLWGEILEREWPALVEEQDGNRLVLRLTALSQLAHGLLCRILRRALQQFRGSRHGSFYRHIESLCHLVKRRRPSSSVDLPERVRARVEGDRLIFEFGPGPRGRGEAHAETRRRGDKKETSALIVSKPGVYVLGSRKLSIEIRSLARGMEEFAFPASTDAACCDAAKLQWPLSLRHWQPGDRFSPLGLKGSKKLQDFFTDAKLPRQAREQVLLLCDQEKIVWVVGHRLDERVKVTPGTEQVLVLQSRPAGNAGD
jgi:tRNA(Ile)-lysidine synthase